MKRHAQKSPCPVSKNFYAYVTDRIRESLGLIGRTDAVEETIACIDRYMADGTVPPTGADAAILLTFNLLSPEIDKALQRSRRARQRAAENKAAADRQFSGLAAILAASVTENHEAHDIILNPDGEAADPEDEKPAPFVPRNRRERRLYEQELRRATRRQNRRPAQQ